MPEYLLPSKSGRICVKYVETIQRQRIKSKDRNVIIPKMPNEITIQNIK